MTSHDATRNSISRTLLMLARKAEREQRICVAREYERRQRFYEILLRGQGRVVWDCSQANWIANDNPTGPT